MTSKKSKDKIEVELKRISKLPGNKTCVDCPEKIPNYVDTTHCTFVCTKCSGLHRELQFKVKGIGLSNFTEEELSNLESVGNTKFNEIYLARFDGTPPNSNDLPRFKDFLKQKYIDKKWYVDRDRLTKSEAAAPVSVAPPLGMANPLASKKSFRNSMTTSSELFGETAKTRDVINFENPNSAISSNSADFDPFGNNLTQNGIDPFAGNTLTSVAANAFDSSAFPPVQNSFNGFASFSNQAATLSTTPIPYIRTAVPEPVQQVTQSQSNAEPVTKNFNAFDDLVTVAPTPASGSSANPFDQHFSPPTIPQTQNPVPSQPYSYGYPPMYSFPGQPPATQYYPHHAGAPFGQPSYYPHVNPYMVPHSYPPNQAAPTYAAPVTTNQTPTPLPKSPPVAAAPDPFSDMTGLALNNLSKAPPPATIRAQGSTSAQGFYPASEDSPSTSTAFATASPSVDTANPFDLFG